MAIHFDALLFGRSVLGEAKALLDHVDVIAE
jgi:hypothetical protein